MRIVFRYHSAYALWVNHTSSGTAPSAPLGSAQAGTEYGPQCTKMPSRAFAYQSGRGRRSVAHSSGESGWSALEGVGVGGIGAPRSGGRAGVRSDAGVRSAGSRATRAAWSRTPAGSGG